MPHTPSASKRLRKSEKRRRQNRTAAKKLKFKRRSSAEALEAKDATLSATEFKTTQAMLDRAANKGYIHPNKAARLKSRLVKKIRTLAAAPAAAPKT